MNKYIKNTIEYYDNNVEQLKILKMWITKQYNIDIQFINYIIQKNT